MDPPPNKSANLFQVYLRLRPPPAGSATPERFLTVERDENSEHPSHIILNPPNDRKRSTEKFAFTQVFEEDAAQLDVFQCTGVAPLVEGVLAPRGGEGTDALLATLGVTGSGKTHTILGSRTQRGLTQLSLDVIFRSIGYNMFDTSASPDLESSLQASDASEATLVAASSFLESVYADFPGPSRAPSRAATPMIVGAYPDFLDNRHTPPAAQYFPPGPGPKSLRVVPSTPTSQLRCRGSSAADASAPTRLREAATARLSTPPNPAASDQKHYMSLTTAASKRKQRNVQEAKTPIKGGDYAPPPTPRRQQQLHRPSAVPQHPDISSVNVSSDPSAEYAVVLSMYEVYNDKIYDLLTPPIKSNATKEYRRRPLLFKQTEQSADRKVVAGLKKIACTTMAEAIMVLEAGLHERQTAGTGSNSTSSRSHGFFCVEVKKRRHGGRNWRGSTFTIVDLAGSERARDAKTHGNTLAEAGKINESLMYLGQCLQAQSGMGSTSKPSVMPFRQCKMTELLFSNSFSTTSSSYTASVVPRRNAQRGVMIVTADAHGDVNATSQILRYSALAREVTIPRIPSITSTYLADAPQQQAGAPSSSYSSTSPPTTSAVPLRTPSSGSQQKSYFPPTSNSGTYQRHRNLTPGSPPGSSGGGEGDRVLMEHAALEIARMQEEINNVHGDLDRERDARVAAEAHLLSMEDRLMDLEQTIREDCMAEFESRWELETARWKAGMEAQLESGEEHWDRKMELFERGISAAAAAADEGGDNHLDDDFDKENVLVENLEEENERLRRELAVLKRELAGRSPSKRMPLHEREDFGLGGGGSGGAGALGRKMEQLRVSTGSVSSVGSSGSPKKKKAASRRVAETPE